MNTAIHHYRGGMGAPCGQGAATVHMAISGGLQTAGGIAMMIPGGQIAGAVLEVAGLISNFFGHPDCSKIAATNVVNQAEQLLKQNLAAWQALPANQKTPNTQAQALANFDGVWAQVQQSCGQIGGSAGAACISDRQAGACHYNANGACWNWFVGYRDPIANDPAVSSVAADVTGLLSGGAAGGSGMYLLIGLALLGGALIVGAAS